MSTKKKRKQQRVGKPPAQPRFSVGDQVRVKYGVADPDFPDIPLGGWAGRIAELDQQGRSPLYLVEWNQPTLDNRHPVFRKRCERDGLEETSTWLGEEDLEPGTGEPVPMEQPTHIITRPLNRGYQDDRIRAILELTSDDPLPEASEERLQKYHDHLAAHLSFPFQATYSVETGPFRSRKYTASVVGLVDADDYGFDETYGLFCRVRRNDPADEQGAAVLQARTEDRRSVFGWLLDLMGLSVSQPKKSVKEDDEWPLADLEVKKGSRNDQLIQDYSYWFGNYR